MHTQAPDVSACRALFNELEFTTMLKELAPEEQATPLSIVLDPSPEEVSRFVGLARTQGFALAFDTTLLEVASEQVARGGKRGDRGGRAATQDHVAAACSMRRRRQA